MFRTFAANCLVGWRRGWESNVSHPVLKLLIADAGPRRAQTGQSTPRDAAIERARCVVETSLNEATERAYALVDRVNPR